MACQTTRLRFLNNLGGETRAEAGTNFPIQWANFTEQKSSWVVRRESEVPLLPILLLSLKVRETDDPAAYHTPLSTQKSLVAQNPQN